MKHEFSETTKNMIDAVSICTAVGAVFEFLPSVAAIFTIFWTGLRIWETETVKRWFKRT